MKFNKKVSLSASLMLMLTPVAITSAQNWSARTVDEISAELMVDANNQMTYIVKYGDTLGAIAEAMNIDLAFLAEANQIENVNLIYPKTKLVAQYDVNHKAEKLNVETSAGETFEMDIPVSLTPQVETEAIAHQVEFEEDSVVEESILNISEAEDFELVQELPIVEEALEIEVVETSAELLNEIPIVEETTTEKPLNIANEDVITTQEVVVSSVNEEEELTQSLAETTTLPLIEDEIIEVEEVEVESTQASVSQIEETKDEVEKSLVSKESVETTMTTQEIIEEVVTIEEAPVTEEILEEAVEEVISNDYSTPSTLAGVSASAATYGSRIANQYGVTAYGIRPGDGGDHGKGLAIDFMVPVGSALGDQIAADAVANMDNSNIAYVIWKQQIYGNWTGGQWQTMEDRGSVTQNHYDHVHVSFNN